MTVRDWAARMPYSIALASIVLMAIGVAAIARADELLLTGGTRALRQALWAVLAVLVVLAATIPHYRRLWRVSYLFLAGAIALLVLVYFFPPINGVRRWIRVGPLGFQPSDLAKLAFVLALARYLMYSRNHRQLLGLLWPLLLSCIPVLLILKEPDLGTALVFLPTLLAMLLAAGARLTHLAVVMLCGLMLAPVLWSQMSREQRSRITSLFEQTGPDERPTGDGYQLHQSKQLLALGGAWGSWITGPATEDPGAYHLPAAATDFVFSIVGERFGKPGLLLILAMFLVIITRGLTIASTSREPFGRLLVVGFTSLFATEMLINVAMTVGLAPITGLSLPLVSYGGSGLVTHALATGLMLNVAIRPGYEITGEPFRFAQRSRPRRQVALRRTARERIRVPG